MHAVPRGHRLDVADDGEAARRRRRGRATSTSCSTSPSRSKATPSARWATRRRGRSRAWSAISAPSSSGASPSGPRAGAAGGGGMMHSSCSLRPRRCRVPSSDAARIAGDLSRSASVGMCPPIGRRDVVAERDVRRRIIVRPSAEAQAMGEPVRPLARASKLQSSGVLLARSDSRQLPQAGRLCSQPHRLRSGSPGARSARAARGRWRCARRCAPQGQAALFETLPATPGESAAISSLAPALGECVATGTKQPS